VKRERDISQRNEVTVYTCLEYGEVFSDAVIVNLLMNLPVKEPDIQSAFDEVTSKRIIAAFWLTMASDPGFLHYLVSCGVCHLSRFIGFTARYAVLARYLLSSFVRPSVCLFVTSLY